MVQRLTWAFGLLLFTCTLTSAQVRDTLFVIPDSTRAFTLGNFYQLILRNHPAAKQAALLSEVARQEIRLARGNFDPKVEAEFSTKQLNGKMYYDIFGSTLKFPTIFPVDPVVGMDRNKGTYLNPERYIDDEFNYQQFYAGISLPLGRGLLTDERRTALRQAELFKEMTQAEQVKLINKLLLDAAKEYWEWYYAYYNYLLLSRSVRIAEEIFSRVKDNYHLGEASGIDTVQAAITWQQRIIEQQEAFISFKNSGLQLSNMLWDSLGNPLALNLRWVPVLSIDASTLTPEDLNVLADQARENHPELRKIEVKIFQLEAERKLAAEYLKPQLNVNYYGINQPINPRGDVSFAFDDNYKIGIDFSFPVFLRKERSKLALTKLKIANTKFERSVAERQIINNLTAVYNQLINLQSIMANQRQMVESYEKLLAAELLNLQQGESDLFKINLQQEKLIQAQSKWLKLLSENEKQKALLYWAAGTSRFN
ncbi:MAG TPA: TolC family protein [Ohtaekwangia sp.]